MILLYTSVFFTALTLSLILTKFFIWFSYKINFLDVPKRMVRKNHEKSTPLLGGSAIFISYFLTVFGFILISILNENLFSELFPNLGYLIYGAEKQLQKLILIFLSGFLVYLLGLHDDKYGIGPGYKLSVLVLITLLLFYLNIKITLFVADNVFSFFITLLWIVFLTNAFNLLDNMNGLCSGTAIVCSVSLLICALILKQFFIALYLIGFIAALMGFIKYNLINGRIFLGDSGSLFIGYNLAVTTLLASFYISGKTNTESVLIPAFVFLIPLYDTLSVIIIRIKNKQPIYKGDLNHFSHRLNKAGFTKIEAVLIIIGIAFSTGLISILLLLRNSKLNLSEIIFLFMFFLICIFLIEISFKYFKKKKMSFEQSL